MIFSTKMKYKLLLYLSCLLLLACSSIVRQEDNFAQQIDTFDRIQAQELLEIIADGVPYVIKVNNQSQFDIINNQITAAIEKGGKNIKVEINEGVYHFHENHIIRENEDRSDVSILIYGKEAIVSSDNGYGKRDYPLNSWGEFVSADTIIQIMDTVQKVCFIPYKNKIDRDKYPDFTQVKITQWYQTSIYSVSEINENGIYFTAPNLKYNTKLQRKGYTVNFDYLYKGRIPRFSLYDRTKEPACDASTFLNLKKCSYRSFSMEGLHFSGNKPGAALLATNEVKASKIQFSDCIFDNIRGDVASFSGTGNILFNNNKVKDIDGSGLSIRHNSHNVHIVHNIFENVGRNVDNTFCIRCNEAQYYIRDNIFRDFSYAAIGVGVWHGQKKDYSSTGIIEENEIYYSPKYIADNDKHTLMDSGAIYVFTQNDNVVIRYNFIHDIEGFGDNRGVFCDDGANNLKIYGNVILNIPNSYCIDSRFCKDQRLGIKNNSNNFMAYNLVDNKVRFMGYNDEERHCKKGSNLLLKEKRSVDLDDKFENLYEMARDITLENAEYRNRIIIIPRKYKKQLKHLIKNPFITSIIKKASTQKQKDINF